MQFALSLLYFSPSQSHRQHVGPAWIQSKQVCARQGVNFPPQKEESPQHSPHSSQSPSSDHETPSFHITGRFSLSQTQIPCHPVTVLCSRSRAPQCRWDLSSLSLSWALPRTAAGTRVGTPPPVSIRWKATRPRTDDACNHHVASRDGHLTAS